MLWYFEFSSLYISMAKQVKEITESASFTVYMKGIIQRGGNDRYD